MRLIDADFLKEWVDEYLSVFKKYDKGTIKGFVDHAPTIEPKRGEWFKDDEGTFICSACGSGYKDQPTIMGKPMFEWCPICGCRMKGADDD